MTTRRPGPPGDVADSTHGQRRESSYWRHVGQMIGVGALGALAVGGVVLRISGGSDLRAEALALAAVGVAVGAGIALRGRTGRTFLHRPLRAVDLAKALLLLVASAIGVDALGLLWTGAVVIRAQGGGSADDDLAGAALGMAAGAVIALAGWIGWTHAKGRLRGADVGIAMLLMLAATIGFLGFYASYGYFQE